MNKTEIGQNTNILLWSLWAHHTLPIHTPHTYKLHIHTLHTIDTTYKYAHICICIPEVFETKSAYDFGMDVEQINAHSVIMTKFYSKKPVILRKLHLMRLNMRMCRSSSDSIREGFVGRWDWVSLWRPPKNQPGLLHDPLYGHIPPTTGSIFKHCVCTKYVLTLPPLCYSRNNTV